MTAVEVEIYNGSGSSPKSVVEFGIEKLKKESDIDLVFFVFDKDNHDSYPAALSAVANLKKNRRYRSKTISAITSNPCFEVWFLMHFGPYDKPFTSSSGKSPCDNVIAVLRKQICFRNYSKGQRNHFDLLSNRLNTANKNAAQVLKRSEEVGDEKHYGIPTTFVHELVIALQKACKGASEVKHPGPWTCLLVSNENSEGTIRPTGTIPRIDTWVEGLLDYFNARRSFGIFLKLRRFGFNVGKQVIGLYVIEVLLKYTREQKRRPYRQDHNLRKLFQGLPPRDRKKSREKVP